MSKEKGPILNKRARFDYTIEEEINAGIVLTGSEAKNVRLAHVQLKGAYVTIKDDELYIINLTISGTKSIPIQEQDQTRTRKLLVKKKELQKIIQAKKEGRTVIPVSINNKSRYIKIKIAIAKGKKKYDKREAIKKRDTERLIRQLK